MEFDGPDAPGWRQRASSTTNTAPPLAPNARAIVGARRFATVATPPDWLQRQRLTRRSGAHRAASAKVSAGVLFAEHGLSCDASNRDGAADKAFRPMRSLSIPSRASLIRIGGRCFQRSRPACRRDRAAAPRAGLLASTSWVTSCAAIHRVQLQPVEFSKCVHA